MRMETPLEYRASQLIVIEANIISLRNNIMLWQFFSAYLYPQFKLNQNMSISSFRCFGLVPNLNSWNFVLTMSMALVVVTVDGTHAWFSLRLWTLLSQNEEIATWHLIYSVNTSFNLWLYPCWNNYTKNTYNLII